MIRGNSLMHRPRIVEGRLSASGKTISCREQNGVKPDGEPRFRRHRFDAERILSGGVECRKGASFRLYTKERMQRAQRANQSHDWVQRVQEAGELPEPTHSLPGGR